MIIGDAGQNQFSTRLAHRSNIRRIKAVAPPLFACHSSPRWPRHRRLARSPTNSTDCSRKT